jgi:predicted DNA-binding transcriptional regulator AlpA
MTATPSINPKAKPAKVNTTNGIEPTKRGYNEHEAAAYIGMSASFLRISRMDGERANRTPGPDFIKVGKAVRYLKEDLDAWLEAHRVTRGKSQ